MTPCTVLKQTVDDELAFLKSLVSLDGWDVIELGCGAADLARRLVSGTPGCRVTALEIDARQHAKNLARPEPAIEFVSAGAQDIPMAGGRFDLALMLKSLHHVPRPLMGAALREVRRVLKPAGLLYVSEPVFAGALNDVVRLFHDEQAVRQAAQEALDAALQSGDWELMSHFCFDTPVVFRDFADFEQRIIAATFADHRLDAPTLARVQREFEAHAGSDGVRFERPMRVQLLRKRA